MCSAFGQWCGAKPAWDPTPAVARTSVTQQLKGSVPEAMGNRSVKDLPSRTKQENPVGWQTTTPNICKVFEGDLVSRRKDGACRIVAGAARSGREQPLTEKHTVTVR